MTNQVSSVTPFIPAEQSLPEITFKAVILAIVITAILAAANAYLALKLGQTISASIPAAVISMGALRFFKKHNILENNIVQTAASGGEGVAAAVSFVLPALIIIGFWQHFNYWETVLMVITGGLLGVLFSIPLRRVMLNYQNLPFPEGTAIGNVLKASASGKARMKNLIQGGAVGSLIALFQTGFKVLAENLSLWGISNKTLFGTTLGFSPALLAAGFIVGLQACVAMLVGLILTWGIGIPVYTHFHGLPAADSYYDMAMSLRSDYIRYIGVGTMLLGGAWTLVTLVKPIAASLSASIRSLKETRLNKNSGIKLLRTEHDIPIQHVILGSIVLAVCAFFTLHYFLGMAGLSMSAGKLYTISLLSTVYILLGGFILASVCAYLSGLVGMTNNPLSGLLLSSVLIASLLLMLFFGRDEIAHDVNVGKAAMAVVIIITSMVGSIVTISGENMQDLKAGQIVGATPWKQQVMLLIGVIVAALVVGPVLELLFNAYGIGGVFPRAGMDSKQMLAAPQAGLMAAVAQGTLGGSLPWGSISIGMGIAFVAIFVDEWLKKRGKRLPILAIGIGIYLPPEITTPIILGGIINYVCKRAVSKRIQSNHPEQLDVYFEKSNLIACGLVAGAALMGVILAVPFVLKGSSDALSLVSAGFTPIADVLSVVVLIALCTWLYKATTVKKADH
jgi:putative OPT family oligopeptide transporter